MKANLQISMDTQYIIVDRFGTTAFLGEGNKLTFVSGCLIFIFISM